MKKKIETYPYFLEKVKRLPYLFAKKNNAFVIEENTSKSYVAMSDPNNIDAINEMRLILNKDIEVIIFKKEEIEKVIEGSYQQKRELLDLKNVIVEAKEGYDLLEKSSDNKGVNILNSIILEAISQNASDIHFEPEKNILKIRYRIDGILHTRPSVSKEFLSQIITRIKVMAKLDIAEKRLPQDGRIKLMINKREIDFRISTMPTVFAERIVLRILDRSNVVLGLENLGIEKDILQNLKKAISMPEGIVLVTGQTGSGKTTTLYSAINELNATESNIMTIEDPVEYRMNNISQITVNPKIGLTFAKGLRHILRQDPDVIMIGEIRDRETAEIAIQAALTGHLVLSTLHTNDAPSAIVRLCDMGIEPYLLSSTIVAVLAQRLVRKICPHCREEYEVAVSEQKELNIDKKTLFRGKGCAKCFNSGYLTRRGIYEFMPVTQLVKKQINQNVDALQIRSALKKDYKDLKASGVELVLKGVTTSQEVIRVTKSI